MNELSTLFNVFSKNEIKKEFQFTQLSALLTLHKVTLSDPAYAKQIKVTLLNNSGQAMKNSKDLVSKKS